MARASAKSNPTVDTYSAVLAELKKWALHEPYDREVLRPVFTAVPGANGIDADRVFWLGEIVGYVRAVITEEGERGEIAPGNVTRIVGQFDQLARMPFGTSDRPRAARARQYRDNPPWITKMLADAFVTLQEKIPPKWLPKLGDTYAKGKGFHAELVEYGCGAYGCVMPTLEKGVVLKVTSDESEAKFATELADTLPTPICTNYLMAVRLEGQKRKGNDVYLLWREEADDVGKIDKVVGDHAEKAIHAQHMAAQRAYIAFAEQSPKALEYTEAWVKQCDKMGKIAALDFVANGLVRAYREKGIFISDVHGGNLGVVTRNGRKVWAITDPGNIVTIRSRKAEPLAQNPQCPKPGAMRFFQEYAGSSRRLDETRMQGRLRSAREYAVAEFVLEQSGAEVIWEYDPDGADFWGGEGEEFDEILSARIVDADGNTLASLSGITDPDRNYRRVIEAELAYEAFSDRVEELAQQLQNRRGRPFQANPPKCPRDHKALKLDDVEWAKLEHIGNQPSWDDNDNDIVLELRNCTCGTTLSRELKPNPAYDERINPEITTRIVRMIARHSTTFDRLVQSCRPDPRGPLRPDRALVKANVDYLVSMGLIEKMNFASHDGSHRALREELAQHDIYRLSMDSERRAPSWDGDPQTRARIEWMLTSSELVKYIRSFQRGGEDFRTDWGYPGYLSVGHRAAEVEVVVGSEDGDIAMSAATVRSGNLETFDDPLNYAGAWPESPQEFMAALQPLLDKYHP